MTDEDRWAAMSIEELEAESIALRAEINAIKEKRRALAAVMDGKVRDRRLGRVAETIPEQFREAFIQAVTATADAGGKAAGG